MSLIQSYTVELNMSSDININLPHHEKEELCTTRPAYRQGNKFTSVKVYTVNQESQHLLIYNVPGINIDSEVHALCQRFGTVTTFNRVLNQDVEDFTCVYHVCFEKVYHARYAKRKMDDMSFFGGVLHVCYAPELETFEETKEKLSTRRKEISFNLKKLEFPQQFRPQRSLKRKYQDKPRDHPSFSQSYFSTLSQYMEPQETTVQQQPGPSGIAEPIPPQLPTVDVKPFKKLIPTKVARIVFHNQPS